MINVLAVRRWVALAVFATGASFGLAQADSKSSAADAAKAAAEAKAKAAAAAVKERKKGPSGTSLQELMKQLQENRQTMIADHDALAKRLKEATDEEKKAIKERMESQMKAFEAQQAALHRQIRDEQRRQRSSAAPGKR